MAGMEKDSDAQQFMELMEAMDDDAQYAMFKLMEMVNSLPKSAPFPSPDDAMEFLEHARFDSIRERLGGTVGQVVSFPTNGMRTDAKPSESQFASIESAIELALLSAHYRTSHISNQSERTIAEMRAAAEEGGAEYLSVVAKWLAVAAPEAHTAFLNHFTRA